MSNQRAGDDQSPASRARRGRTRRPRENGNGSRDPRRELSDEFPEDEGFEAASVAFHSAVCHMSGNSVLDLLGESLRHLYHNRVRTALTPLRTRAEVRATHLAIADAIIEGRADEAERLMREHMEAVAKGTRSLRSILDEGIEWT